MKIAHVALCVANVDRSAAFYRKAFGLSCREKYQYTDIGLTIGILKKDGVVLELFGFKKHRRLPAYRRKLESDLRTIGTKHVSFAVRDILTWYRKLRKAHLSFATPLRVFDTGQRYFFVKDPDGILIELMEDR